MTLRELIDMSKGFPVQYLDLPLSVDTGDDLIDIESIDECMGTMAFSPSTGFSNEIEEINFEIPLEKEGG